MDSNRFFLFVNRFNSIMFLLILLVSGASLVFFNVMSSNWQNGRSVTLKESSESNDNIELVLGGINAISGSTVLYVNLSERDGGSSYSSGSMARGTRNVLFFKDNELKPRWLFESNEYLIEDMDQLRVENNTEEKRTVSLLYEVIYKDSNSNKQLDPRDKITISLSKIDGSEFKNVIESADSLIDHNVSRDGKEVALIYQVNKKVIMERVSLESFQSISKSELTQVEKI